MLGSERMTDIELQQLVEELSIKYFKRPFIHTAYFNPRLRTTGGRYLLNNHNIEFNKKSYEVFGMKELRGIILHELCHYHLHIQGKGYKHRDADFRSLLKKVGAPRFCSTIEENKKRRSGLLYVYECVTCNQTYNRRRRIDILKYKCGKCFGQLQLKEKKRNI